jgi:hypothetical protein
MAAATDMHTNRRGVVGGSTSPVESEGSRVSDQMSVRKREPAESLLSKRGVDE